MCLSATRLFSLATKLLTLGLVWTVVWSGLAKSMALRQRFSTFCGLFVVLELLKLVQSVILPIYTFWDSVYFPGLSAAQKKALHKCYKSSLRFVYNMRRLTSTVLVRNAIIGQDLPNDDNFIAFAASWDKFDLTLYQNTYNNIFSKAKWIEREISRCQQTQPLQGRVG